MFRLARRLGCLFMLAIIGVVGWMTRELWLERVAGPRAVSEEVDWSGASDALARSGADKLADIAKSSGPVYTNITAGEIAALVMSAANRQQPGSLRDVRGAVVGDELRISARVDLSGAPGLARLGPLASLLDSPRDLQVAGHPAVREPGVGVLAVESITIDRIHVPRPVMSAFLDQLIRRDSTPGGGAEVSSEITFPLPRHVADLRVSKGGLTVYKRVP
ncbi:MAG: hypothetical protein ACT4OZ_08365 [Gemmatimonadota bacterium]